MKQVLRRARGALKMGLMWGLGWGVVGGAVMEGIVDPHGRILDMWPQTLAIPGFLAGVVFSIVLGIAERRRGFAELLVPRFGVLGAVAGLVPGGLIALMAAGPSFPFAVAALGIAVPVSLLSAVSAAGSLALARKAEVRELPDADTRPTST